jgi:hypothetical protein
LAQPSILGLIVLLLPILGPDINKKKIKRENIKQLIKHLEENKKFIGEKNIPERPGNYQKLVKEDQNIQD